MSKKTIACFFLLLILVSSAWASWENGARPIAMGGAFTGQADDVNAAFFNPAGLGMLKTWGICGTTGGFMEQANMGLISWALPTEYGTVGITVTDTFTPTNILPEVRIGYNSSSPTSVGIRTLIVSYGYELNNAIPVKDNMGRLAVGANLKSVTSANYSEKGLFDPSQLTGTSADVAMLYRLNPMFSFGIVAQDAISSTPYTDTKWNAGVSFRVNNQITLNQDLSATGVEIKFGSTALRAGYSDGVPSAGAGINLSGLQLDYAYRNAGVNTQSSHYLSLSFAPTI